MKHRKIEKSISRRSFVAGAVAGSLAKAQVPAFHSHWDREAARPWTGADYWANPMQDWRVRAGRAECFAAGGDRNLHLLTCEVTREIGDLMVSARMGRLEDDHEPLGEGFAGFRIGIRGHFHDWRDSAIYGEGVNAGITADGHLFIGMPKAGAPRFGGGLRDIRLTLRAQPQGARYLLTLRVSDPEGGNRVELTSSPVTSDWLTGGLALVCSSGPIPETPAPLTPIDASGINRPHLQRRGGTWRFW